MSDYIRPVRYFLRLPLLMLHLFIALPPCVLIVLTIGRFVSLPSGERLDHRVIRWWSHMLVRIFGVRIKRFGQPVMQPALLVANHITWMDIELIHSQRKVCFVAKSEIAKWPLVGWLASQAGTIYHRRGNTNSLQEVMQVMVNRLQEGHVVAVFPEGGTGTGDSLRTFHARIFQVAFDANVVVQPVALKFVRNGERATDLCFYQNEQFFPNFWRLLGSASVIAEIYFLEPLQPSMEAGRRHLADRARLSITQALGLDV